MLIEEKINGLEKKLGFSFKNPLLLQTALIHSSYIHENPQDSMVSNERLEFLGDAVLDLVVADILFDRHTHLSEGDLSKLRSFAVNEETLAKMARHLDLADFLTVGKGEKNLLHQKDSIMADAFEAIIGAIYLDTGIDVMKKLWLQWQSEMQLDLLDPDNLIHFDAKSKLQEFCLKTWKELPQYDSVEHASDFRVTLKIQQTSVLCTQNQSKKKAELWLAQQCLKNRLHLFIQRDNSCF